MNVLKNTSKFTNKGLTALWFNGFKLTVTPVFVCFTKVAVKVKDDPICLKFLPTNVS